VNDLKTRFFDDVDKNCPLPEYPRPQLVREDWLCLNGECDYEITPAGDACPKDFSGKIILPFAIESQLSGVQRALQPDERLWYRKRFTLDSRFDNKRCILHFGAVDWQCEVFVNGVSVGTHTGGYCPFSFDITDELVDGENELVVKVYDPTDKGWQNRGKQVLKSVGFWYTGTSGIWQTVWLEPVAQSHITCVRLTPDIDAGEIIVSCTGEGLDGCTIEADISLGGEQVYSGEMKLNAHLPVPDAKLWSPESPTLYDLVLTVKKNGEAVDTVKSYFGMRKLSVGKDKQGLPRLMLNNEPYFQRGLLDQGYWSDGGLTPPNDEAMIFDIAEMKRLGFNMLRKHIKVEPLRWYYHCDRLGMIVWQDMVSGGEYIGNILAGVLPNIGIGVKDNKYNWFSRGEKEWRDDYRRELFEMIDNLYNCTCIGCWVPFNEGWGQFDAKEIGDAVKAYDPSRIVDHASGWYDQKGCDLKSMHKYILPIHMPKLDGRPFVISEYGGYSMILDGHVWNKQKSFGYIMFRSKEKLSAAYKKLHEKQVIPLIKKGLCATVYTQVSDVEFEVNGMYTYDRKVLKLDEKTVQEVNSKLHF